MNSALVFRFSMELVAADIISEFIPLKPVLDNRDELIQEQILAYNSLISDNLDIWKKIGTLRGYTLEQTEQLIEYAILLVRSDIASNFIGHSPVLCDRITMIIESVTKYMNLINVPKLACRNELPVESVSVIVEKPKVMGKKNCKRFPRKGRK